MQKPSSRIERPSTRSTTKVAPKKATPPKGATKKTAPKKRTVKRRVYGVERIRINRLSRPLIPWENLTEVVDITHARNPEPVMPDVENIRTPQSSTAMMPTEHRGSTISVINAAVPETTMAVEQDSTSLVPSRPLMLWENQTYAIQGARTAAPQISTASAERFWKQALAVTMKIPPALLSLLGWRTSYAPISQERLALQMLILNGSVRASNVEFRYSTSQEEAKNLSRSFAVLPPPDRHHLTPLQKLRMRLHAGGTQFIQRLYTQHAYARLHSRGMQLFERIRRELTIRSYLSRI